MIWLDSEIVSAKFLGEFTRYRVRAGSAASTADQPHLAGHRTLVPWSAARMDIEAIQISCLMP